MSLKRVGVLLGREIVQGPKGFLFIMAIVAPIILSLVVSLVFGTLFNDIPRMGIVDEGAEWAIGAGKIESRKVFDTYAERGGNFIDTANTYTDGASETMLGEFLQGRRDQFVVAT